MDGAVPSEILPAAEKVFGERLPAATRFAELLVTDGVVRGLIGPREAPRIWERHLLNCAVIADLIPSGASVVDVGSGAGLPGMVLAVARPDLSVTLVEPLARRTAFLSEAVTALGLERTTVVRARAEEGVGKLALADVVTAPAVAPLDRLARWGLPPPPLRRPALADVVTARAVAPLDRLAGWCLPLTAVGGHLLAMKGASAAAEIAEHAEFLTRLGAGTALVRTCGDDVLAEPTTVVDVVREREGERPRKSSGARERNAVGSGKSGDARRRRETASPRETGDARRRQAADPREAGDSRSREAVAPREAGEARRNETAGPRA